MYADLHIHTYFSDGTMSPEDVVKYSKRKNVSLISVCDHNTIAGYERFEEACKNENIDYIRGVEISADYENTELHILAYSCDFKNKEFLDILDESLNAKEECSTRLINRMSKDYSNISPQEYEAYERKPERGAWKGVDYLLSKEVGDTYDDVMKFYKEYDCMNAKLIHVKDIIRAIHSANGKAVLAHPVVKIKPENYENDLNILYDYGLDGVECYYPSQDKECTDILLNFCRDRDMLITAGCDGHGEFLKYILGYEFDIGITKIHRDALYLKDLL